MRLEFEYAALHEAVEVLETALGESARDPAMSYLVVGVGAATTTHVVLKVTNGDVVMVKVVPAKVQGFEKSCVLPIEGERFVQLVKASDNASITLEFDLDNRSVEYRCNRLASRLRVGGEGVVCFPDLREARSLEVVPVSGLYSGVDFCRQFVSADAPQMIEHGKHGFCAGSQSRFGLYSAPGFEGLRFNIPVVSAKALLAFIEAQVGGVAELQATADFLVVRFNPVSYVALRSSVEKFADISGSVEYPEEKFREIVSVNAELLEQIVKRVAVSLGPGDERMQFSAVDGSASVAKLVVQAVGEDARGATEFCEVVRSCTDEDVRFAVRYPQLLTSINLVGTPTVELRIADNFVRVAAGGASRAYLATLVDPNAVEPVKLVEAELTAEEEGEWV